MSVASRFTPAGAVSSLCRHCRLRLQRQPFRQASTAAAAQEHIPQRLANSAGQSATDLANSIPRWARTPPAMKAPHRANPKNENMDFPCNEDPVLLDETYVKMLGKDGDKLLSEDVKWLAVTHKSFDQGRRGFNDRLAFLGRRIIELQTDLALLDAPETSRQQRLKTEPDVQGRLPFVHKSLRNVENVDQPTKEAILDRKRISQLGQRYGLNDVIRWKPRQVNDLQTSGLDTVLRDTLYAVVGAIALQKGGEVANQIVRQRILSPLGLT